MKQQSGGLSKNFNFVVFKHKKKKKKKTNLPKRTPTNITLTQILIICCL